MSQKAIKLGLEYNLSEPTYLRYVKFLIPANFLLRLTTPSLCIPGQPYRVYEESHSMQAEAQEYYWSLHPL